MVRSRNPVSCWRAKVGITRQQGRVIQRKLKKIGLTMARQSTRKSGDGSQLCGQCAFEFEQLAFDLESPSVTAERTVGCDDAMAGHDDGNGIAIIGQSHCTISMGGAYGARDIGVGAGLAVGDIE